jgi:hypothetical protein
MAHINETSIFISVKSHLLELGWHVLGGQPPSGTDHLPVIEIRDPTHTGKGSKGSYKPDLVAWHDSKLFVIELKPYYDQPDRVKVNGVLDSPERISSLWQSLIQRNISLGEYGTIKDVRESSTLVGGLGYGGSQVEHPELWRFFVKDGKVEVTPGTVAV